MKHKLYNISGVPKITWDDLIEALNHALSEETGKMSQLKHSGIYNPDEYSPELYDWIEKGAGNRSIFNVFIISNPDHPYTTVGKKLLAMTQAFGVNKRGEELIGCPIKYDCQIYFSFVSGAVSHGRHHDEQDVFIWQLTGETELHVWEDDQEHVHKMTAGNCVYVPKGMDHSAISNTPRAVLSIAFSPL